MARKNCSPVGGQAVLEGVMMRGPGSEAVAVRDPLGVIQIESRRLPPKPAIAKIPVIRGIWSFVASLIDGTKTLIRSGEVYGEDPEEEESAFEKKLREKLKINPVKLAAFIGAFLGVLLAIAVFVIVPTYATKGLYTLIKLDSLGRYAEVLIENLTIGFIKVAIFLIYIALVGRMKEIKRLFAYHGAEHKTIACYEAGEALTPENVIKHTRFHDRCGTNFIFIVMMVSVIFNAVFFALIGWDPEYTILEVLVRIALIPLIAGCAYEVLKLLAKFDNPFVRVLKAPGLALQRLTTREPDESMTEVAIAAFNEAMALENDPGMPTKTFVTFVRRENSERELREILKPVSGDSADTECRLILMHVTDTETVSALKNIRCLRRDAAEKAKALAEERATGKPLQYVLGEAYFYGRTFKSDKRALIPRLDSEFLAEAVIDAVKGYTEAGKTPAVLELCTGSGALAVTVSLETGVHVDATDIDTDALSLADENVSAAGADVELFRGDLFDGLNRKYDIIFANPPYIPSRDIDGLAAEVRDWEPGRALDGGADGLDFYRRIAAECRNYLNDGGMLILEAGAGEADAVDALFGAESERIKDYNIPPVDRVLIYGNICAADPGSSGGSRNTFKE